VDSTLFVDKLVKKSVSAFPGNVFGGYESFIRITLVSDRLQDAFHYMLEVREELENS